MSTLSPRALYQRGRFAEAAAQCRDLIASDPSDGETWHLLALCLADLGAFDDAAAAATEATLWRPDDPLPLNTLGNLYRRLCEPDLAELYFLRALALPAAPATIIANYAACLLDLDRAADAVAILDDALQETDMVAELYVVRGDAHARQVQLAAAASDYRAALDLAPQHAGALCGLAETELRQRRFDAAAKLYRAAGQARPGFAEAELGEAHARLAMGDYQAGFILYESRWRAHGATRPPSPLADWAGDDPRGRSILVEAERGFGDVLQFARFLPILAERGARVTLAAPPALHRLMQRLPGLDAVVAPASSHAGFDTRAALLSLPRLLRLDLEAISGRPYLSPSPDRVQHWCQRFDRLPGRRIGLVWSGNTVPGVPGAAALRGRAASLAAMKPLAELATVSFVSLQLGAASAEAANPPSGMSVLDIADDLTDFAETAAAIAALDLVVTIDSAVAHLAGSLGTPTLVALMHDSCWRWLDGRDESPWYESIRLFRQPQSGDWQSVFTAIARAIGSDGLVP